MERVVILDNIRSIHNVGSIFRTADAAGFSKVYLCGVTPTPLDRFGRPELRLAKVALGAEKSVAWESTKSTGLLISRLRRKGYKVYAIEQSAEATSLFKKKVSKTEKIAILMGEETKGLSPALLKKCDAVLEIPMHGEKESLNVSVAFGIAAYHFAN
jgi:23S rRNA (guanosine2251-2'-O)-methyltransferase